jgi:hypothetical protein
MVCGASQYVIDGEIALTIFMRTWAIPEKGCLLIGLTIIKVIPLKIVNGPPSASN